MKLKIYLILPLVFFGLKDLTAQSNVGISVGFSDNDKHIESAWFQHQLHDNFNIGLQLRYSKIKYRFTDAIAVTNGNTLFAGIVFGYKIKEVENYRLDFNLTTSYRYLRNRDIAELKKSTNGIEIDPNIIFSIKASEKFTIHTGSMFRMAMQIGTNPIPDEQLPSAIILAGISYSLNNTHNVSFKAYTGPMNGAQGDTMKYFNQISISYQYSFGRNVSQFKFFNF